MAVKFGSARIDENGNISGGKAGDQTGKEVAIENGYVHGLGWVVLRPKSVEDANGIANSMRRICENDAHGYSQADRYSGLKNGVSSKIKDNLDCSSAVRLAIKDATGKDVGEFYTGNEKSVLLKSGLFTEVPFTGLSSLYIGDVLVTKSKGHTVVVVEGTKRSNPIAPSMSSCIQCEYNASDAQLWYISDDGKISNPYGVLDLTGGTTKPMSENRDIWVHADNGTPAQRWIIQDAGNAQAIRSSIDPDYCLAVVNKARKARARVALVKYDGTARCKWDIVKQGAKRVILNHYSLMALDSNPKRQKYQ